jgi:hypothetical protein
MPKDQIRFERFSRLGRQLICDDYFPVHRALCMQLGKSRETSTINLESAWVNDAASLQSELIQKARQDRGGRVKHLSRHRVQCPKEVDDEESAQAFAKLSSTNGSGGVLDIFYKGWKMDIATSPKLFGMTNQLWKAAYFQDSHDGEDNKVSCEHQFKWHPHGAFDCKKGYMYINRIGYI